MKKPNLNSQGEMELVKAQQQLEKFEEEIKELTLDQMNKAPKLETEPQTQLSQQEIKASKDIYLKPVRSISSKEKFLEKFRDEYNFKKEYVHFIAENNEIIGERIEIWTKAFPGLPAEFWEVPTNKPVWGPRYLAEQIKGSTYHRLTMNNTVTNNDSIGNQYYGSMAVQSTVQRLDARPAMTKRSLFFGASGF